MFGGGHVAGEGSREDIWKRFQSALLFSWFIFHRFCLLKKRFGQEKCNSSVEVHFKFQNLRFVLGFQWAKTLLKTNAISPQMLEWIENSNLICQNYFSSNVKKKKNVETAKTAERKDKPQFIDTTACFKHQDDILDTLRRLIKN